jgi:uncharacterized protein YwgA
MFQINPPENSVKKHVPVTLLKHAPEQSIHSLTRMQNLVFIMQTGSLLDEEPLPDAQCFEFVPHNHGPYSSELKNHLDRLARNDTITSTVTKTPAGNTKHVYQVTDENAIRGHETSTNTQHIQQRVKKTLSEYASCPLLELMDTVNITHPEYLATR